MQTICCSPSQLCPGTSCIATHPSKTVVHRLYRRCASQAMPGQLRAVSRPHPSYHRLQPFTVACKALQVAYALGGVCATPVYALCCGMLPNSSALLGLCSSRRGQKLSDVFGGGGGTSTQAEVAGLRRLLKPGGHARCPQGRLQAPGATRSHA